MCNSTVGGARAFAVLVKSKKNLQQSLRGRSLTQHFLYSAKEKEKKRSELTMPACLFFSLFIWGGRAGRISVIPYFAFLFFFSVINLGKDAPIRNRNAETAEPSCLFTYAHSIDRIGAGLCLFLLRDKKASWQFYLFVFLFLFCYENSYFISKSNPLPRHPRLWRLWFDPNHTHLSPPTQPTFPTGTVFPPADR